MTRWQREMVRESPRRYHAIRCFTCQKDVPGKSALRLHRGHEVHYVDRDGRIDD